MQPALAEIDRVPSWFPDWNGKSAAIIASGPSTKKAQIDLLQGKLAVIAIKKNVELCPWADVVYGCDAAWWKSVRGLPDYKGLKLAWSAHVCDEYPDIRRVFIDDIRRDQLLFDQFGHVGAGGNSGFHSLNMAVQFGAKRIVLIGFDMHDRSGVHWYGRNNWPGANNPSEVEAGFPRFRRSFNAAALVLEKMGVEVVNASPISELKCFPKLTLEQTLAAWGM